ncbi:Amidase [Actinopolyspora xinjiangensis]|uniref:Amidase n=1 Tax=Actinopolyspora xinjiangensis TaxID=405564 RepID=A0A1H0TQG8_9ACTN|nr:amidase family protein [Actinopolyspora xinjiangensis]SDP56035.1 Amidase [Actinopolyspora xinjiangensis]
MNIREMSATALRAALRRRELSPREVLEAHLARVEERNPGINAIVTLTEQRARREAGEADRRLARGEPVGALHGLPMAHKDTHLTGGVRTTFGSPAMREHVPAEDELLVARLRAAGSIRLGKTNVPEFGAGSHTFNPVFGVTRNPHDPSRSAGGSSGGAAAALASGMQPLADGSDMGGSLRNPASFCGVVGLRPSPRAGAELPEPDTLVAALDAGTDGPHGGRRRVAAVGDGGRRRAGPALGAPARLDVGR